MYSKPERPYPDKGWYLDRYATNTNQHLLRGQPMTYPYCWIDTQWQRGPAEQYNTARLGGAERWGPDKVGRYCKHPKQHSVSAHYRPASETPFEWRFTGGQMVSRFHMPTWTNRATTDLYLTSRCVGTGFIFRKKVIRNIDNFI